MGKRDSIFMFAVLLFVCASLLYLDWRRQGEIELLHERVDGLLRVEGERYLRSIVDARPASMVERILSASDDRTLADIAREGA